MNGARAAMLDLTSLDIGTGEIDRPSTSSAAGSPAITADGVPTPDQPEASESAPTTSLHSSKQPESAASSRRNTPSNSLTAFPLGARMQLRRAATSLAMDTAAPRTSQSGLPSLAQATSAGGSLTNEETRTSNPRALMRHASTLLASNPVMALASMPPALTPVQVPGRTDSPSRRQGGASAALIPSSTMRASTSALGRLDKTGSKTAQDEVLMHGSKVLLASFGIENNNGAEQVDTRRHGQGAIIAFTNGGINATGTYVYTKRG